MLLQSPGEPHGSFLRFLYADPTPSALQVFLRRPGTKSLISGDLPAEEGDQEGMWINADPIPGCVVCNIGESKCSKVFRHPTGISLVPNSVGDLDQRSLPFYPPSSRSSRDKLPVRSAPLLFTHHLHAFWFSLTSACRMLITYAQRCQSDSL